MLISNPSLEEDVVTVALPLTASIRKMETLLSELGYRATAYKPTSNITAFDLTLSRLLTRAVNGDVESSLCRSIITSLFMGRTTLGK